MNEFTDNTHRSLQSLVSINAWFSQDPDNKRRLTLHADVSFGEERLGGDSISKVTFKLSVKRCDIIFIPPVGEPFRVDPASVHSPRPLNPKQVIMRERKTANLGFKSKLSLNLLSPKGSVDLDAGYQKEKNMETTSEQVMDMYHEVWKRVRGNHAWTVDGRQLDQQRLAGPVFDAHSQPRLTLVDQRTDEARERDRAKNMEPVSAIKVSCLREDIDIYDIAFKSPSEQASFDKKKHKDVQLLAAREVLKEALIREGLIAGDLAADPYAEMTICDVAITISD